MNKNKEIIDVSWQAPEYEYYEKTTDWYWILGFVTVAIIMSSAIAGNWLLAVMSALCGFSVALYGSKEPETITFRITSEGVRAGRQMYRYEDLHVFWIDRHPWHDSRLLLHSKSAIAPHVVILLDGADQDEIRETLSKFLKEEEIQDPIIYSLMRIFKL